MFSSAVVLIPVVSVLCALACSEKVLVTQFQHPLAVPRAVGVPGLELQWERHPGG